MSPRLQELILSPEGLMIAGMTALMLVVAQVLLLVCLRWHDDDWRRHGHQPKPTGRVRPQPPHEGSSARRDPQDPARWTP